MESALQTVPESHELNQPAVLATGTDVGGLGQPDQQDGQEPESQSGYNPDGQQESQSMSLDADAQLDLIAQPGVQGSEIALPENRPVSPEPVGPPAGPDETKILNPAEPNRLEAEIAPSQSLRRLDSEPADVGETQDYRMARPIAPRRADDQRWPEGMVHESEHGDVVLNWITPHEVSIGQQVHCQLQVRNSGHKPVQGVIVSALLNKNVQLDAAQPKPKQHDRKLVWELGEIEGQGTHTIELDLTPQSEGEIEPQATVTFTRISQARISVLRADLQLAIEGPQQIVSGQAANFQFVASNPGRGRAHNVVVEALLGDQLKNPEGNKLTYAIGTLGPGESRTVQVPITGAHAGRWEIAARATASGNLDAQQKQAVEVVRPRLELAIDGPRLRYVDRQATYTIRVHNPGPAPANNVQVFDAIPAGFRFVDANGGGTFDHANRNVAWFVGRLEAGSTAEVGVQLIATEVGAKRVAAQVKADSGVVEQAETETQVQGIATVVLDVIDTEDPIEINGQTCYEIRVTNRGTETANQVQVAARLPRQIEAIDVAGPTRGKATPGQIVFEPITTLLPGQSELFRVKVLCREVGQVGFKAYLRSSEQTKPVVDEEVTQIYQD